MPIRPYHAEDASPLAALYRESVSQLGIRRYTPEQVAAWLTLAPTPEQLHTQRLDGRITLVAVDSDDHPLGFTDLEADGHIHYLYCSPTGSGQGVASALYQALEHVAREQGMGRLYAEASEVARGFFQRQGFTVTARREFLVDGIPLHNYAVEKLLDPL